MINRIFIYVAWALTANCAWADALESITKPVHAYMQSVIEGTPKFGTGDNASIDVNEVLGTNYENGLAFGARAWKDIDRPYAAVKAVFDGDGEIERLIGNVKTLKDFRRLSETKGEIHAHLAIVPPVIPNFHAQVAIKAFGDTKGHTFLFWKSEGDYGDVEYTEGVIRAEANGEKTRLLVVGIFILKPARKVPWIARGSARSFARTHYADYIRALERTLGIIVKPTPGPL